MNLNSNESESVKCIMIFIRIGAHLNLNSNEYESVKRITIFITIGGH